MYVDGLVDHIMLYGLEGDSFGPALTFTRKHTRRKSMRCDCGQTFTRRTDLQSHVEMVHTGLTLVSMSVNTKAGAEVLPRENQISEPVSTDRPSRARGDQTQYRCKGFPPCSKSFEDEYDLLGHVK